MTTFFAVGYKFRSSNDDWIEDIGEDNSNPAEHLTNIATVSAGGVITCRKPVHFLFLNLRAEVS